MDYATVKASIPKPVSSSDVRERDRSMKLLVHFSQRLVLECKHVLGSRVIFDTAWISAKPTPIRSSAFSG